MLFALHLFLTIQIYYGQKTITLNLWIKMKKMKVAVTIRSFNKKNLCTDAFLKRCDVSFFNETGHRLDDNELIRALHGAEAVIAGTERFGKNVFSASPDLRIISRVGVGIDNIDLDAAKKNNIVVLFTPEAPVQAVAEHTIALMLSVLKHIPLYNSNVRAGDFTLTSGSLLSGKVVGIVGMGRIGKKVAEILIGFGCGIIYYDPFVHSLPEPWEKLDHLEDLIRRADILSLHSPPQADGSPIITSDLLSQCRRGTIIINTSRGSVIDERALMRGLDSGIISGAGLDVFSVEPYTGPLLKYQQVIATPHVSSNTTETREKMENDAIGNLLAEIEGTKK